MTTPTHPTRSLPALALATLLAALGTSIANVALPALAHAFAATFGQVQWVALSYLVAVTVAVVAAGRLGDVVGHRRLLVAGIGLFTASAGLAALAPSLRWLLAARALQGVGAAAMMALTVAFVGAAVPREQQGRAMGLLGSMSAVGTALGPSLGGVLLAAGGWRAVFLVHVPLGLVALVLARRHLPRDGRAGVPPVLAEKRAPLIRMEMLRGASGAGLAMSVLVAAVLMATLVVGPFHLSRELGLGPVALGGVMSLGPVAAAVTGVPAGRLTDRIGTARATRWGLLAIAAGTCGLSLSPASLPGYVLPLVVLTSGYALFQTANNTAVMAGVGTGDRGAASGLLNLARHLGLVAGASVMGAVFATAGLRVTFAAASILVLGALRIAGRAHAASGHLQPPPVPALSIVGPPGQDGCARCANV